MRMTGHDRAQSGDQITVYTANSRVIVREENYLFEENGTLHLSANTCDNRKTNGLYHQWSGRL